MERNTVAQFNCEISTNPYFLKIFNSFFATLNYLLLLIQNLFFVLFISNFGEVKLNVYTCILSLFPTDWLCMEKFFDSIVQSSRSSRRVIDLSISTQFFHHDDKYINRIWMDCVSTFPLLSLKSRVVDFELCFHIKIHQLFFQAHQESHFKWAFNDFLCATTGRSFQAPLPILFSITDFRGWFFYRHQLFAQTRWKKSDCRGGWSHSTIMKIRKIRKNEKWA